jgi:hypothetical protein
MFELSPGQILGSLVFGGVGFVCFVYGKKQTSWKPMVAGIVLIGLPYLLRDTVALWAGGALILAALYVFRD